MLPSFNVAKNTLLKPEFTSNEFSFKAGSSFVVKHDKRPYLLTAHHLFGPAAGLEKRYTWKELNSLSPSVKGFDFDNYEQSVVSGNFISIKNALGYNKGDPSQDLAVFQLPEENLAALSFADSPPSKGDKVYLYARLKNTSKEDTVLHSATVTESNDQFIEYKFDNRFLNPRATSGAAVLNQAGNVVGMNIAAAGIPIFNWKGRANSLTSLRRLLDQNIAN